MHEVDTQRVVYGSYGQLWLDGDEIAEIISCKATLTAQKTAIKRSRHLVDGYKTTGYEAKGSIKLHKVSSYLIKKLAPAINQGRETGKIYADQQAGRPQLPGRRTDCPVWRNV